MASSSQQLPGHWLCTIRVVILRSLCRRGPRAPGEGTPPRRRLPVLALGCHLCRYRSASSTLSSVIPLAFHSLLSGPGFLAPCAGSGCSAWCGAWGMLDVHWMGLGPGSHRWWRRCLTPVTGGSSWRARWGIGGRRVRRKERN